MPRCPTPDCDSTAFSPVEYTLGRHTIVMVCCSKCFRVVGTLDNEPAYLVLRELNRLLKKIADRLGVW